MKVSDLMVGDWIHNNYTNENYQVWPAFFTQATNFGKRLDATFEDINIAPIPLTLEILEKNGLTRESDGKIVAEFFKEDDKGNLEISADSKGIWWTINYWEYEILCLKYVHELQHALKLCGINKEITL